MPSLRKEILNRIILTKALFRQGSNLCLAINDQIKFSMGLIAFHDAVDQILGTIADQVHLPKRSEYMMQLFDEIEKQNKDSKKSLLYRPQIKALNTLRNNIKHQGILPDLRANAHFPTTIEDFLQDTCGKYFGIDFKLVSLADLIKDDIVKNHVKEAERQIANRDYKAALEQMAMAMFYAFERQILARAQLKKVYMEAQGVKTSAEEPVFPEFDYVQDSIDLLSKGIDLFLYSRFKNLTPRVGEDEKTKKLVTEWDREYGHKGNWTEENCLFCYDFLVDAVLKLQGEEYRGYRLVPRSKVYIDVIEALEDKVPVMSMRKKPKLLYTLSKGETREGLMGFEDEASGLMYFIDYGLGQAVQIKKSQIKVTEKEMHTEKR